ncbi:hypothetical protein ACJ73_07389 [Blastomyces percursus]|uniref:C3H1-type domain-containing protein n=1 Tax=Blastomyces percursus TaxID=1658174 RepID=A0A1J9QYK3_9EURO|nr:hypothetical protein ACJ73_07389 [Blastomyces percursus]
MRISFLLFHLALGFCFAAVVSGAAVADRSVQGGNNNGPDSNPPGLPHLDPGDPDGPERDELERREWEDNSFSRRNPLSLPPSECKRLTCYKDDECKFKGCTFCHRSTQGTLGNCF